MPQISATTRLLGVIGDPIAHSLSPAMHNAAFEHLGLDCTYLAFPVTSANLATAIKGLGALGALGCSVTIPHKQAVIPLLTGITDLARAVAAVNTIWQTPEGWQGTNTDVAGFISPLFAMQRDWTQTTAVILGNGGAARAVVAGCHQLGCGKIWVVGRDAAKLAEFERSWQAVRLASIDNHIAVPVQIQTHQWDKLGMAIDLDNLLLINTTPIGMHSNRDRSPVTAEMMRGLRASAIVYDLIYTPRPTLLLQLAAARGAMTIDGVEMLVQQGAAAWDLWLHQAAPVEVMRQALIDRLR